MTKRNRHSVQQNRQNKRASGYKEVVENEKHIQHNDWKLDWFEPSQAQKDIVTMFDDKVFCIVDSPSGCGKTTTALYLALRALKNRQTNRIIFTKNPTEIGDDQIGFLTGSETNKLATHYETTKEIFYQFLTEGKLESMMNNKNIKLTIPNFMLGATFDDSIIVMDECQLMSPDTMKFMLERCGVNTKYLILGDSRQRYAVKKREDGFCDLIDKVKEQRPSLFGYVEMSIDDNERSDGSKQVLKLYGS